MSKDQIITISLSSDDEDDFKNCKERCSKSKLSALRGVNHSSTTLKKQPKKERDKIEVKVVSKNSHKKDLDFSNVKKKYSIENKNKKDERPNVFSHKLFAGKHSKTKPPSLPEASQITSRSKSPELVDLDKETEKKVENKMPPLADLKLMYDNKPVNFNDYICNLANISPEKSSSVIARKSKMLEKEFAIEPKNNMKALPNPASIKNSMIILPLKHHSFDKDKPKKEKLAKDSIKTELVNGCKNVEKNIKEKEEVIEIVNLEDAPEKEKANEDNKNDTNENEAVHESKLDIEEKMDCIEDEKPDAKRKREEEEEDVVDKDKEDAAKVKRAKNEEVAINVPDIYNEFIELLKSIEENEMDREKALKKLNKYHNSADPKYTSSSELLKLLKQCTNKVKNDKLKLYPMLNDIFASLKSARGKKSIEKRVALKPAPDAKTPTNRNEILKELVNPEDQAQDPEVDVKNEKAVRRLIKTLKKLEKKIKRLEEAEVDLDDETDSSYFQMQKYRERFVQVHKKLCEYTGDSPAVGRVCKSKIPFSGTKYPAVNKCIERWLNKKRMFPDFTDILKLIEEQNRVDKLSLTPEGIRTLAMDTFRMVGEMLQRIRLHDFCDSYLTYLDETEDPADNDPNLAEILRKNQEESSKKIAEILNHYSEREVKEHYVAEEVPDDEADHSPVESGDEDEKEIEEVENSLLNDADNRLSEDEGQSDEEKKSKEDKPAEGPSTSEKVDNPVASEAPQGETSKIPDEVTPVRESKNNYKHCKSLKWRRENNSKVNSSELCNGDNNKPVSDGDTVNDLIPEKGESLLKENNKEPNESAGEKDTELVENPKIDLIDGIVDKKVNGVEERKDFECEIIDVDSPLTENNENTYNHLKNHINPKPFFVNYVRVEYFLKDVEQELFKNPFDRLTGFALRDSTNLNEIIHLNDEGFWGNFKISKKKENRSPNFVKSKKVNIFKIPFRKRMKRNFGITRCVLENNESKGVNGDGQGKEQEERNEAEENEEAQEPENSAGDNGSGNGRGEDDDEGEEDKDGKEIGKEEKDEEDEEDEEQEEQEEQEEKEVETEGKEEKNDVCDKEDRINGNYDADTDEDSMDLKEEATDEDGMDLKEEAEKVTAKGEGECGNDFDKKLKAFEDALEDDDEEDEINEKMEESKINEKAEGDEVDEKVEGDEAHEKMEDYVSEKMKEEDEEEMVNEKMEQDEANENVEDEKIHENVNEENPNEDAEEKEDVEEDEMTENVENDETSEMDASEKLSEREDNSNDSAKDTKNENEDQDEYVEHKNGTQLSEHESEKSPEVSSNDASREATETAAESKETEELMEDSNQDDNPETKTKSEDKNESELKTDEELKNNAESSETPEENEKATNEDADAEEQKDPDEEKKDPDEEQKDPDEEQKDPDAEQTEASANLEPSEDLNDEPGPSSKRKSDEPTDVEVLSFKKPKISAKTDPLDEEIVQNFLRHSPSSISITPPKKFSKPPSQEALNALATLRQMKNISTTRVTKKSNEDDVQVIGESSTTRRINNGPISITRITRPQNSRNQLHQNSRNQLHQNSRNQLAQNNRNRGGVPVISNVQSINRNNNLTPKIVTVQGNVSSFHNNRPNFNFGMQNRMMMNMNSMNMNSMISIPGFNHFPRFNNQFNNFSMFNNRQQPPLKISNVRGNISQTFRPQLQQQQQPRRFVTPQTATNARQIAPTPSSTVTKEKSKKPVEYVVLE